MPQKFQNSGGGFDLFWKKSKRKVHFFLKSSLTKGATLSSSYLRLDNKQRVLGDSDSVISRHLFIGAPGSRLQVFRE